VSFILVVFRSINKFSSVLLKLITNLEILWRAEIYLDAII